MRSAGKTGDLAFGFAGGCWRVTAGSPDDPASD
jgi:hypothetical protein